MGRNFYSIQVFLYWYFKYCKSVVTNPLGVVALNPVYFELLPYYPEIKFLDNINYLTTIFKNINMISYV